MFLFSWGKRGKPSQSAEVLAPVRGGITAAIKLCETDKVRAYNEFCRSGVEHKVTELNDKQHQAVEDRMNELIAAHNDAVVVRT